MYKITEERPESGQFLVIWEYDGIVWSQELRWSPKGKLEAFYQEDGDWSYFNLEHLYIPEISKLRYIIKE